MTAALADAELVYLSCNRFCSVLLLQVVFGLLLSSLHARLKTLRVNFKKAFLDLNKSQKSLNHLQIFKQSQTITLVYAIVVVK